jgi:uncharacterized OsmC-like protein
MEMTVAALKKPAEETMPGAHIAEFVTTGRWRGNLRTDVDARHFAIPVAEPEAFGGDDSAPNPMELLLAGLDGCLAVVIETVAAEYGATVKTINLITQGALDARGFLGTARVRPYFQTVRAQIDIDIDLSRENFRQFTAAVEARCPAATLFKAAGVDLTVDWVRI